MKSGSKELHFSTPPFAHTQRMHLSTKVGDSRHGIRLAQHRAAGPDHVKCLDYNMQTVVLLDKKKHMRFTTPVSGHWSRFWMNGYTLYKDAKGHFHKIPLSKRHWSTQKWVDYYGGDYNALKMLYRRNGDQILTWPESVAYAKRAGVVLTPELKSQAFRIQTVANIIVETCRKADYPCWSMALTGMKYCKEKCSAIIKAGGHFATIYGRGRMRIRSLRVAATIKRWPVKPSARW
jgi:hypothetical protein